MKFLFFIFFIIHSLFGQNNDEKVILQLDWKYQFEFAGFIAAKEKGFYHEAGLDVEFKEYQDGTDIVSDVLSQKANYGVYNSSIVVENGHIKPIVLLATYFQRSPLIFVAQKGIKHPINMLGKTIMGTKDELKYSSLALLLNHFSISSQNARLKDHTFHTQDFLEGKVDVMSAFRSNQLYELDHSKYPYEIIDPAEYGFVMSAVNLFTSQKEALDHTERTQKFIDASNKGWEYALDHPDEIITLLLRKYTVQKSREALIYEAKVTKKLMMTDFYPIGQANAELSIRSFKQLDQAGSLVPGQKLGHFMFKDVVSSSSNGLSLTSQEKEYLLQKKKIVVCVDPEWYPFEAIREGKHIGIAADVMKNFEHKLGIPFELRMSDSWETSIVQAKKRECDIYSLASSTPDRLAYMDFTSAYITLPIVMATKMDKPFTEDVATLVTKKLGIVKGYAIAEKLKTDHPDLEIVEVQSITDGLKQVESGELYGYIDNLMVISSYIQKEYPGVLKVSSRLEDKVELGVGTRNDEPYLHDIFEKLVQNLDEATMQTIYNRWVSTVEEVPWIDRALLWKVILFFAAVMIIFLWRYYDLKRYNKKLLELSTTDKLTGLYNRQKTDEMLSEERKKVHRYRDYACSVMIIDVDLFKAVNDTYGHQRGDQVLQLLAEILLNNVRSTDSVGRWGGEEFMIILPHTTLDETAIVAESLRSKVEKYPFNLIDSVTISIGIGEFLPTDSVHECIGRIDSALYQAKANGRNQVYRA